MSGLEGNNSETANGNNNIPLEDVLRAEYFDDVQAYWIGQKPIEHLVVVVPIVEIFGD